MAFRPLEYVKDHPWTVAAIVAGGLVLYYLYSMSSGSGTTVVSSGTTVDPNADALAAQQMQLQAGIVGAQIASNVQLAQTDAAKTVSLAGIAASAAVQLAGEQTQFSIAQLASNDNQATIAAQVAISGQQAQTYNNMIAAQTHIADVNAATQLAIVKASTAQNIVTTLAASGHRGVDTLAANFKYLFGPNAA